MQITLLKAKIHTVIVTEAELEYHGSVTIDEDLMDAAGIVNHELVHINNRNSGSRIISYAIPGPRGSGVICMNGAAALHNRKGDVVHILVYANFTPREAKAFRPIVVHTKGNNEIDSIEK